MSKPSDKDMSIDAVVGILQKIAGLDDLPTDVRLADLGVDSMDVLEWIFTLEERLEIEFDDVLAEDSELEAFGDATLRDLYDMVVSLSSGESVSDG